MKSKGRGGIRIWEELEVESMDRGGVNTVFVYKIFKNKLKTIKRGIKGLLPCQLHI